MSVLRGFLRARSAGLRRAALVVIAVTPFLLYLAVRNDSQPLVFVGLGIMAAGMALAMLIG